MPIAVTAVERSRTYHLRQQVLRPHESVDAMSLFDGDDHPDSGIFAAVETGTEEVVGTANVRREEAPRSLVATLPPAVAGRPAWRLRGVATREDLRGRGIGARVLEACLRHVAAKGGGLLWCNARVGAGGFYRRAGFFEFGERFEQDERGPHIVMWRTVDPYEPAGLTNVATGTTAGRDDE